MEGHKSTPSRNLALILEEDCPLIQVIKPQTPGNFYLTSFPL